MALESAYLTWLDEQARRLKRGIRPHTWQVYLAWRTGGPERAQQLLDKEAARGAP